MTFEEVAIAFAKQLMRAEQAEMRVKELEEEVKKLNVRLPDGKKE